MRAHRIPSILGGTTAIALASLLVASPASAATLPDGQKITIVEAADGQVDGQFFEVSAADAASTPVGVSNNVYVTGLDVNDDGLGFAIGQLDSVTMIWPANANTGVLGTPVPVVPNVGPGVLDNCGGLDLLPNGQVVASCTEHLNQTLTERVGVLDPTTGILTPDVSLTGDAFVEFIALAYDAVTDVLWGFSRQGNDPARSFIIDLDGGTATPQAPLDTPAWAADFDRDGQLFVAVYTGGEIDVPRLATADPTTGAIAEVGIFVSTVTDAALIFVHSLTIWGKALPATGPAEIVPIGLGTALLFLAGAAFIATSRIQRKQA